MTTGVVIQVHDDYAVAFSKDDELVEIPGKYILGDFVQLSRNGEVQRCKAGSFPIEADVTLSLELSDEYFPFKMAGCHPMLGKILVPSQKIAAVGENVVLRVVFNYYLFKDVYWIATEIYDRRINAFAMISCRRPPMLTVPHRGCHALNDNGPPTPKANTSMATSREPRAKPVFKKREQDAAVKNLNESREQRVVRSLIVASQSEDDYLDFPLLTSEDLGIDGKEMAAIVVMVLQRCDRYAICLSLSPFQFGILLSGADNFDGIDSVLPGQIFEVHYKQISLHHRFHFLAYRVSAKRGRWPVKTYTYFDDRFVHIVTRACFSERDLKWEVDDIEVPVITPLGPVVFTDATRDIVNEARHRNKRFAATATLRRDEGVAYWNLEPNSVLERKTKILN